MLQEICRGRNINDFLRGFSGNDTTQARITCDRVNHVLLSAAFPRSVDTPGMLLVGRTRDNYYCKLRGIAEQDEHRTYEKVDPYDHYSKLNVDSAPTDSSQSSIRSPHKKSISSDPITINEDLTTVHAADSNSVISTTYMSLHFNRLHSETDISSISSKTCSCCSLQCNIL